MSTDLEDDYFQSQFTSSYWDADPTEKIETKRVYLEVISTLEGFASTLVIEKRLQPIVEKQRKALQNLELVIKFYALLVTIYLASHFLRETDPPASNTVTFLILFSLFLGTYLILVTVDFSKNDLELNQVKFKRMKFEDDAIKFKEYYGLDTLIGIELKSIRDIDVNSIFTDYSSPNDYFRAEVAAQFKSAILGSIRSNSF